VQTGPTDQTFQTLGIRSSIAPKSKLSSDLILSLPIIKAKSQVFSDSLLINLSHVFPGAYFSSYFTDAEGKVKELRGKQFYIHSTGTVTARAIFGDKQSKDISATYYKRNNSLQIKLTHQPDAQYTGNADDALVDELRGSKDFRTGAWQGFRGQPLEAIIDLGKIQQVNSITLSTLRDIKSWIFHPVSVEYYISRDGKEYFAAGYHEDDEWDNYYIETREWPSLPNVQARYIKVIAKPLMQIPEGHLGVGEAGWIFADEIIIK
jgi:hypothetical protein